MHRVRAYFCSFLSVAYTTLNKLFAVFFIYYRYSKFQWNCYIAQSR